MDDTQSVRQLTGIVITGGKSNLFHALLTNFMIGGAKLLQRFEVTKNNCKNNDEIVSFGSFRLISIKGELLIGLTVIQKLREKS